MRTRKPVAKREGQYADQFHGRRDYRGQRMYHRLMVALRGWKRLMRKARRREHKRVEVDGE